MKTTSIVRTSLVDRPIDEVFEFFANIGNLEAITPPWLRFEILTPPPITLGLGTTIDCRLRFHGFPLHWQSQITVWQPSHRFVDEQRRGPFRSWVHSRQFFEHRGGTRVMDKIEYSVYGDGLIDWLFINRNLKSVFDYRQQRLTQLLEPSPRVDIAGVADSFPDSVLHNLPDSNPGSNPGSNPDGPYGGRGKFPPIPR